MTFRLNGDEQGRSKCDITCLPVLLRFLIVGILSLSANAFALELEILAGPNWDAFDATTQEPQSMAIDKMVVVTVSTQFHKQLIGKNASVEDKVLPAAYQQFLNYMQQQYGAERVADWPLHALNEHCFVFELRSAKQRSLVLSLMKQDKRFKKITPMSRFKTLGKAESSSTQSQASVPYNDPFSTMQYGLEALHITELHPWSQGEGVLVAVIDTGVDVKHKDLQGRMFGTKNVVDEDDQQFLRDFHGTAISSMISANANNGEGMVGIAPQAKILAIKACWEDGADKHTASCSSFNIIKALDFALKQKAQIINLSLSGPNDEILQALVEKAYAEGVIVVGSVDPQSPSRFPAVLDEVLAVAQPKSFSQASRIDVIAPGKQIVGALPGDQYEFFSGNSFATAYVSGIIALIKSLEPDINAKTTQSLFKHVKQQSLQKSGQAHDKQVLDTCVLFQELLPKSPCS